jgi:predicted phosphodiesterase
MSRLLQEVQTGADARLIFIGDIHGCYDELVELLDLVAPASRDVVISVGDVVTKGPAAARCLDLWRDRGYLAVQGNNEQKLLEHARPLLRFFVRESRDVLRRTDLLRYIASWPLVLDFPAAGVTAVHGGFLPRMRVTAEDIEREQETVVQLRWIRKNKGDWKPVPKEKRRKVDVLWSDMWRGERFVVYGHTPVREPKIDRFSLGLDTGCVYGGTLTAAIFAGGKWKLMGVRAKRKYAE